MGKKEFLYVVLAVVVALIVWNIVSPTITSITSKVTS